MTWTFKYKGVTAAVSAESVQMAVILLERSFSREQIFLTVKHEQLIPMVTSSRYARILSNGE